VSSVEIELNKPRRELELEGYRVFRYAPSIQLVKRGTDENTDGGKTGIGGWIDADEDEIWRHPSTGALMVRPSGLRPDLFENSDWAAGKLYEYDWRFLSAQWDYIDYSGYALQSGSFKAFKANLPSPGAMLNPISVNPLMEQWQTDSGSPIIWTHETNNIIPQSTGFGVIVQPFGTAHSRGSSLFAIGFGNRFVLELNTAGFAKLFTIINGSWQQIGKFDYTQGGVKPTDAVQINVIPNGRGYLTFLFSQASKSSTKRTSAGRAGRQDLEFTVDVRKYFSLDYDPTEGAFNTIPAAPLLIGVRRRTFTCVWSAYINVYPTDLIDVVARPEPLIEKKQQGGLVVEHYGIFSTANYPDGKPWLDARGLNTAGSGSWTADDLVVPVELRFRASTTRSPEMWGYRLYIPEQTVVPTWEPIVVSDKFQKLTWKSSLDSDPQSADIQLLMTDQMQQMQRCYGPITITVKGTRVWDGYLRERRPTLIGHKDNVIMVDRLQGVDMSQRLAENHAGFESIAGITIRTAIEQLFQAAGFALADLEFDSSSAWMDEYEIPQPEDGDQDKTWEADTSVADALKSIAEMFGVQDKMDITYQWRPVEQKWFIRTDDKYDPETPPEMRFWLTPAPGTYADEQQRWDAKQYHVLQQVEFTTTPPQLNAVRLAVGKSTREDTSAMAAHIGVNPDLIGDDSHPNFMGRVVMNKIDAPKHMTISSQGEAERFARFVLDRFGKKRTFVTFTGEWQPGIQCGDQFAMIGYLNPDGEGNMAQIASFGAYRITEMEVTILYDTTTTDWSWTCAYTAEYLGKAEYPEEEIVDYTEIEAPA
jgi:hypothetical protein